MIIPRTQPHHGSSIRRRHVMAVVASLVLAVAVLTATGCRMLKSSTGETLERIGLRWQPLGSGQDAIQLEFMTLKRPGNDPLLGESLWNRLDTIGRRPARMRSALDGQGIRVGQVGATPPPPLEELLGLTAPEHDDTASGNRPSRHDLKGWRVYLRDGGETEVVLHESPLPSQQLDLGDEKTSTTYHNVRYLLRIRVRELRVGWVRLECLPEVHHGRQKLQPTATEVGWGLRTRQDIVPLYDLRFTVDLTEGEMTVVTTTPIAANDSIGRHFFTTADGRTQLLVARLAGLPRSKPLPERLAEESN